MRIVPIVALVLLAGCSLLAPRHDDEEEIRAHFVCTNGETLEVRFSATRRLAVLIRNDQSIELPQQPSGSGFVYSNGPTTIRGKGNDLIVEIGRMVPLDCQAE